MKLWDLKNKKNNFFWYDKKGKSYWEVCTIKKIIFWYNIKMLEITIDNCNKCDIETINDQNNSQHFLLIEEI